MGGTNTETIDGLRLHISAGDVHVHDDKRGLKFTAPQVSFKSDVEEAMECLDKAKKDCMVKIDGSKGSMFLAKDNGRYFMFISDGRSSVKTSLKKFLKGC